MYFYNSFIHTTVFDTTCTVEHNQSTVNWWWIRSLSRLSVDPIIYRSYRYDRWIGGVTECVVTPTTSQNIWWGVCVSLINISFIDKNIEY